MPIFSPRNELVEKIRSAEEVLRELHGDFTILAVIQRDDDPSGLWDIVVSAPWITDERSFIKEFLTEFRPKLTHEELMSVSRVVVLRTSEPFVLKLEDIQRQGLLVNENGSNLELIDITVNGIPIKHAYLITSSIEEDSHAVLHS